MSYESELPEIEDPWYKGPIRYIIGIFLLLILVLWFIPVSSVRLDPSPSNVPSLSDVLPDSISVNETNRNSISMDMVSGFDPVIKSIADAIVVPSCSAG